MKNWIYWKMSENFTMAIESVYVSFFYLPEICSDTLGSELVSSNNIEPLFWFNTWSGLQYRNPVIAPKSVLTFWLTFNYCSFNWSLKFLSFNFYSIIKMNSFQLFYLTFLKSQRVKEIKENKRERERVDFKCNRSKVTIFKLRQITNIHLYS